MDNSVVRVSTCYGRHSYHKTSNKRSRHLFVQVPQTLWRLLEAWHLGLLETRRLLYFLP